MDRRPPHGKGQVIEMAEQNNQQSGFAHVKIPAAFLHPHTITTEDGRTFDKAFVHIPPGTKVNGVDLSGYSCDVFVSGLHAPADALRRPGAGHALLQGGRAGARVDRQPGTTRITRTSVSR